VLGLFLVSIQLCAMLRLFLLLIVLLNTPAWSQTRGDAQRARDLGKTGFSLYKAGDFEGALASFKEANGLHPNPTLDVNIGKCYEQLDQLSEALLHCKIALNARSAPAPVKQAARACLERIEPRLQRPILKIESTPSDATIRVDGRGVGKTPWSGDVSAGRRQIDIDLAGYRPYSRSVVTELGKNYRVFGSLIPGSVGALLTVTSVPEGAAVSLDGAFVGSTPLRRYPVDARSYTIEVSKDGFVSQVISTGLADGSHLERTIILVSQESENAAYRVAWPGWTLVGIGAAATILGGYFGVKALMERSDAQDLATTNGSLADKPKYDRALESFRDSQLTADLLIVSGGLTLTGGILALTWD
jgi:tetratricopeptide (TPR) repeat protein